MSNSSVLNIGTPNILSDTMLHNAEYNEWQYVTQY